MRKVSLTIDGTAVTAPEGQSLLWAALDNGIYVPNLCSLRSRPEPLAACRLCFVEIEGRERPVTACTEPVADGIVVNTRGERALGLTRSGFELLMASHALDCAHCAKSGSCELQQIAHHLKVKLKSSRLRKLTRDLPVDDSHPQFVYDPNKCVLCGRCIQVCRELGMGALGFAHRGFDRRVTTFGDEPMGNTPCQRCLECIAVCPTGALLPKEATTAAAR